MQRITNAMLRQFVGKATTSYRPELGCIELVVSDEKSWPLSLSYASLYPRVYDPMSDLLRDPLCNPT